MIAYAINVKTGGGFLPLDANGNTLEGGITVEAGVVMPSYVRGEDEKKKFDGAKPGDIIIFNPKKAYPDNDAEVAGLLKMKKEEVKELESDFSYQVTEIRHFQPAAVDAKLFERIFGEDCKTEADFRQRIAADLESQMTGNSDYKFMMDVHKYMEEKVGELTFPEALLKRIMLNSNKEKGEEYVEQNFKASIEGLKWHLIKEQLVDAANIKVETADLKAIAKNAVRQQYAQYGIQNLPDEMLEQQANEMMKKEDNVQSFVEQAIEQKLTQALKQVVTLDKKEMTFDEFRKMMEA